MTADDKSCYASALALLEEHRWEEAALAFSRLLGQNPTADMYANRAACLVKLGRIDDAVEDITRSVELAPESNEFLIERGNVLELLGRLDEALADYCAVLKRNPVNSIALNNRACVLRLAGRYEKAIGDLEQLIAYRPDYWYAHFNLGLVYADVERFRDAARCFETCVDLASKDPRPWIELGRLFGMMGDSQMALDALDIADQLTESKARILYERGVVFHREGNYKDAIAQFSDALRHDTSLWKAVLRRAESLVRINRFEDAVRDCAAASDHFGFDTFNVIYSEVMQMATRGGSAFRNERQTELRRSAESLRRTAETASIHRKRLLEVVDDIRGLANSGEL